MSFYLENTFVCFYMAKLRNMDIRCLWISLFFSARCAMPNRDFPMFSEGYAMFFLSFGTRFAKRCVSDADARLPDRHKYTEQRTKICTRTEFLPLPKVGRSIDETIILGDAKTALQWLLDAIMMLTFFDAVVIAIATCSYRDSNMMLST